MIKLDISEDIISMTPLMESNFIFCVCFKEAGVRLIEIRKIGSEFRHNMLKDVDKSTVFELFAKKTVKGVVEIAPRRFLFAINGEVNLVFYDFESKKSMQLYNPTNCKIFFSLLKCPGFDLERRPYVFLKDKNYISVINVRTYKILPLIKSFFEVDMIRSCNFEVTLHNKAVAAGL
jgi:hypothetical protein